MWTWIPLYLAIVYQTTPPGGLALPAEQLAAYAAFTAIGIGGVGSVLAGFLSDRVGRTRVTILSMMVSGACALTIGLAFHHPLLATMIALLWGFSVVADSAQFSSSVSELADPAFIGTQLTAQTTAGFLLTMVSIRLIPGLADAVGWRWVFGVLAVGPAFGIWAMNQLRRSPAAKRLAGGRG